MYSMPKLRQAFTLIELIVVIGILSVLLTIVLVAINPARQFAQANNTKRRSDTTALLNAVHQYAADNKGVLPTGITAAALPIRLSNPADPTAESDICALIVPTYIAALPADPLTNNGASVTACTTAYSTGYTILKSATNNRVTVAAPAAELSEIIAATR